MKNRALVRSWFQKWEDGNFQKLPLAESFQHTSPFGVVDGKETYLSLVESNRDSFLGNRFEIHDEIYEGSRACVRCTMIASGFSMEVSEWFEISGEEILSVKSYYNVQEPNSLKK